MPRSTSVANIKQILKLLDSNNDMSNRMIGKIVNCSKDTVKFIRVRSKELNLTYNDVINLEEKEIVKAFYPNNNPFKDVPEPDVEYCIQELKKKNVTVQLLWEEYFEKYPNGLHYTQFKARILKVTGAKTITAHFERKAGEKMEIDWSGDPVYYIDMATGERIKCYVFVSVIGRSGYAYIEIFRDTKSESFLIGVIHALTYFGGVPKFLIPDNDKSAVLSHGRYQFELNKQFSLLADYYGTVVLPARVRKPKDKPLVENAVYNVAERALIGKMHNQEFHSFKELSDFAFKCLEDFNSKPFSKKEGSRKSVFLQEDKTALSPLPKTPYELVTFKLATVSNNYHIEYKGYYYSVPYQLIGKKVELHIKAQTIEIYYDSVLVATHIRLFGRGNHYSTKKDHMPKEHQGMDKNKLIEWGNKIDNSIGEYLFKLFNSLVYEEQGYKAALGIIDLSKKDKSKLLQAIIEANNYHIYSYKVIKSIFERLERENNEETLINNSNIRGNGYYQA